MKDRKRSGFRRLCLLAGIGLLIAAAVLLVSWQRGIYTSAKRAEAYVQTIRTLIPEPQGAVLAERGSNAMPVLSVEGTDFVGILELPGHGSALPVCADWGQPSRYPCCFRGSIYDGSMQIGGTSQKGQYDFYREISAGDVVFFTDMTGNRYAYEVKEIHYEKRADQDALEREDAALTLFTKNVYAFEYVVIFCDALS